MTQNFLLNKSLVPKIAKSTNALLILQWAHDDTLSKHWNATDPNRCSTTHRLQYWIMIVVKDDEPRSAIELMNDARKACEEHSLISVHILRKREALKKLKNNNGDFATIYRLGYSLYNTDTKVFPQPGYARNSKKQAPVKRLEAIM